ncbi:MAG: metal ABC transporter permease, partial [Paracoccaceae bacterium]|nr:metal ABC transporter permease [Paracoccaceae bacterium]
LEGFLLGATAGMLRSDALLIAWGGALTLALVVALRRPMTAAAFDPGFATAAGQNLRATDLALMALALAVTLIGLKVVGLILIVALLIIPPAAARFWTDRADAMALLAALLGGVSGYFGAALSASAPALPTGPLVVLTASALFAASLLAAPRRGLLAAGLRHLRTRRAVHIRQGLLALAQGQPIYERYTLRLLARADLARPDGVATDKGRAEAAKAMRDEARWALARRDPDLEPAAALYDALRPIETVLTADELSEIDARLAPRGVPA